MRRIVIPLAITPALFFGTAAVATANPAECALDEITNVVGMDPRGGENVDGVRVVVEGAVPVDIARTIGDTVAELMTATGPVRTAVEPIAEGVIVTVRGVTGDLPPELESVLSRATGCLAEDTEDGASDADEPAPAESAGMECRITGIVPVDAEGEAITAVSQVEGAIVSVAGPLPVGVEATIAEVFSQAGAGGSDVAVQIVQGVDGIQAEVEGVAGPLPADLSTELATALGCTEPESAHPAPSGTDDDGATDAAGSSADAEAYADAGVDAGDGSATVAGNVTVAAAGDPAMSSLPRTGGDSRLLYGAGSVLAVVGLAVRRFLTHV